MVNKYLEKLARLGDVGKAIIRTKLAPAMSRVSRGEASKWEAMARSSAGSRITPRVFSTPEYAQHSVAMAKLAPKLATGMRTSEANKLFAVASRAKKMGVI